MTRVVPSLIMLYKTVGNKLFFADLATIFAGDAAGAGAIGDGGEAGCIEFGAEGFVARESQD